MDEFQGRIGRTVAESEPWWAPLPAARESAPNILVILFDDLGFSHFGCFGSTIETPNIDRLAAGGLRYNNFHATPLCSPTRAALLTGRNHHAVGMRGLSAWDTGFPNCTGAISHNAATLAEMLGPQGYSTFAVGKWHLAPMDAYNAAGPFDHWPLGRGFDRYYGFMPGETDQFTPELTCDNRPIDPPRTPAEGYHLSEDLVDQAIGMVRGQKSAVPERPCFLYLAFGATHATHQSPKPFRDKYRGRFDAGWDVVRQQWFERQKAMGIIPPDTELAPRNPGVVPWDTVPEDNQRIACRLQEAFAGFLDHTDREIGRLVDFLEEIGELDNTLILLMADNGASQEGGPNGVTDAIRQRNGIPETPAEILAKLDELGGPGSYTNYPWGWAQAGNTPGKRYKQNTHGGGVHVPLIAHWPKGLGEKGAVRSQFHHVTDIAPTILEAAGIMAPDSVRGYPQMPIHGVSLAYTFAAENRSAPSRKRSQYFEMYGHRGIWADGWKAVTYHPPETPYEDDQWELYHLAEDFSEFRDLAQARPEKLKELVELWWTEAGRYGVLPLDDRKDGLWNPSPRAGTAQDRRRFTLYPPLAVRGRANPPLPRGFTATAKIERPTSDVEGVIFAVGSRNSGMALYILGDRLVFDYNLLKRHLKAVSSLAVPVGASSVAVTVDRAGKTGRATLAIDGEACGAVEIPFVLATISMSGMSAGRDAGAGVSDDYRPPFDFQGTIKRLVFDVPGLTPREALEARRAQTKQELASQ